MKTLISNDIKIKEPSSAIVEFCKKKLVLDNPEYITAKKVGRYTGNICKSISLYSVVGDTYVLPFGTLQQVWRMCDQNNVILGFHEWHGNIMKGDIELFEYQRKAVHTLIAKKNGVLEAPCGSGKTIMGLQLIRQLRGRALWLTHTKDLLEQSLMKCKDNFKGDFGTITQGKVNIGKDITFATVQTMAKLDPELYRNAFDIVIVDECHHLVGTPTRMTMFYKVVSNCNSRYKYGLSATLSRSDNLIDSLYYIIGEKLYTISEIDVGDKRIKAQHVKVDVDIEYPMCDYLDYDGTLNYISLINMLSACEERNNMIVDNVLSNLPKKQLVLCHRVAQVDLLADRLKEHGVYVNAITGRVKNRKFDSDIIVSTYSLAKEGLDIPTLDILHLATPQKNDAIVKQSVGRIERNVDGKEQPICYDYVDNKIGYCLGCFKKRKRILK